MENNHVVNKIIEKKTEKTTKVSLRREFLKANYQSQLKDSEAIKMIKTQ